MSGSLLHGETSSDHNRKPSAETIMKLQNVEPKHHDILWTILFILHIGFDIYLLVTGINQTSAPTGSGQAEKDIEKKIKGNEEEIKKLFLVILCIIVASALAASGFVSLMKNHALGLVKACFFSTAVLLLVLGVIMLKHSLGAAIVLFCMVGLYVLYYFCFRAKFKFAAILIAASGTIIKKFSGLTTTSVFALLFQGILFCFYLLIGIWFCFWGACATFTMVHSSSRYMGIYLIFSFYWMHNVIQNVQLCIVAGVCGTWFFLGSSNMPENPTKKSVARAFKYSFGSIAFGSALIAILQTIITILRQMERQAESKGNMAAACVLCCVRCVIQCISDIARWFQRYVMVHVALYGTSFIGSAKKAVTLMMESGFDAIINDQIIAPTLFMFSFLISVLASVAGLVASYFIFNSKHEYFVMLLITSTVIGFLIGYATGVCVTGIIDSCVVTLFVCSAEVPFILKDIHPEMYYALIDRYGDKIRITS